LGALVRLLRLSFKCCPGAGFRVLVTGHDELLWEARRRMATWLKFRR
jgi:hypothetical protein